MTPWGRLSSQSFPGDWSQICFLVNCLLFLWPRFGGAAVIGLTVLYSQGAPSGPWFWLPTRGYSLQWRPRWGRRRSRAPRDLGGPALPSSGQMEECGNHGFLERGSEVPAHSSGDEEWLLWRRLGKQELEATVEKLKRELRLINKQAPGDVYVERTRNKTMSVSQFEFWLTRWPGCLGV